MTTQVSTIYLVRHGETHWNKIGRMQGHSNTHLNRTGKEQARRLKHLLREVPFNAAYASDLYRAMETATILIEGRGLELHTVKEFRERTFGMYEGKSTVDSWNILRPILDSHDREHPHLTEKQVEPNNAMRTRVEKALLTIVHSHKGETILVVAHHGVIKQLLIHLGYVKAKQLPKVAVQNLAYVRLVIVDNLITVDKTHGISITSRYNH